MQAARQANASLSRAVWRERLRTRFRMSELALRGLGEGDGEGDLEGDGDCDGDPELREPASRM